MFTTLAVLTVGMNNSSTVCDRVCWVQWCVYVPILVAGFPLNLAALWQLLFHVRRWNESTVYLANLMINDSLLMFSLPFKMHAYGRDWTLGRPFCSWLESLLYVNIYGSIMLSVCIAVDRYIGLQFPFAARCLRSPRKACLVCLAVWICVFASSFPIYTLHDKGNNITHCFQTFSRGTWQKRGIVVAMEIVFCSSAVMMVFCSVRVMKILRDMRERNPGDPKLRNNKSVKIVLSNLVVFLICFIPYHIATPMYFKAKLDNPQPNSEYINQLRYFIHISICISSVNCLADGACYYFILKENLESAQRERRMAIRVRDTRIREPKTRKKSAESKLGDSCYSMSKVTEMEICVDTGFT
ncbi:G-protein coupled receptor 55 [Triplophysa tibetana]|uniref:G-protein coupled receptor 55 n=1 Tax=Triplophysa tibetana TaxID=1572043 RepID=A0A5A9MXK3_9TELE|nr:G-protein coupled receptor 55 [Triplophysa tibetana]